MSRRRATSVVSGRALVSVVVAALLLPMTASAGELAALQTADPSCADDSGATYVDCENGTVTDNRTGLVWLADASCYVALDWRDAMRFVGGLADQPDLSITATDDCGLSDGSSPGDWRLPSIAELQTMVAGADGDPGEPTCAPTITDDQGTGCWDADCHLAGLCAFSGVLPTFYWSSTSTLASPTGVRFVDLDDGGSGLIVKTTSFIVWPVRGGQ